MSSLLGATKSRENRLKQDHRVAGRPLTRMQHYFHQHRQQESLGVAIIDVGDQRTALKFRQGAIKMTPLDRLPLVNEIANLMLQR